jgi:Zn-dependent protease
MFFYQIFHDPVYFASTVIIVILSISIHELFHALAALSQGDDTAVRAGRLTLNPLAHMGQTSVVMLVLFGVAWGQTPVNPSRFKYPFSDALVSFAGPFANLLLLVLSVWAVLLLQKTGVHSGLSSSWASVIMDFFSLAAMLNAFLFLFNMLPVPPLDGFGILETFLPFLRPLLQSLSQYGFFLLIILFMFFGLGGFLLGVARLMVWKVSVLSGGILQAL